MSGTEEGSIYFDIREVALLQIGNGTEGVVRGLLGDGQLELWTEVYLGNSPRVQVLPLWTDDGQVERFAAAVDDELLQKQLLEAVQQVFSRVGSMSQAEHHLNCESCFSVPPKNCRCLAA